MNKENTSKNLDFDIVIACTYDDRLLRYLTTMREHYDGHCKLFLLDQHNTAPTNIGELFDIDATIIYERWNRTIIILYRAFSSGVGVSPCIRQ